MWYSGTDFQKLRNEFDFILAQQRNVGAHGLRKLLQTFGLLLLFVSLKQTKTRLLF